MQAQTTMERLMIKFLREELTPQEHVELEQEIGLSESNRLIFKQFSDIDLVEQEVEKYYAADPEAGWQRVLSKYDFDNISATSVRSMSTARKLWLAVGSIAAAAILVFGIYKYTSPPDNVVAEKKEVVPDKTDIAPGGYKATLTYADGSGINLDLASSGKVATQGNVDIEAYNGEITYKAKPGTDHSILLYNTLKAPVAGMFRVRLSDGTLVWLNAASSLKYPASFSGTERRVELTGEGYFEVSRNSSMPFIVTTGGAEIEVLGTIFNVNAYPDENIQKTTLLQGSIVLRRNGIKMKMNTGMQAIIAPGSDIKIIKVDKTVASRAVAWKNGSFDFHDDGIESVMRKLAKWYDISFTIAPDVPNENETFIGEIKRDRSLLNVLHIINGKGNVSVQLIDKKVIVSKLK